MLYFYTITYKAKYEGQVAVVTDVKIESDSVKFEELERENQQLRQQIEAVQDQLSAGGGPAEVETSNHSEASQSFGAQTNEQSMLTSEDNRSLVLFHDAGAITVDTDSEQAIAEFIERMSRQYGAENLAVVINSPKRANSSTQNQAKRLAVARMLNVRNTLLDSAVNRERIQLTVVETEEIEDSIDWTRLQIKIVK